MTLFVNRCNIGTFSKISQFSKVFLYNKGTVIGLITSIRKQGEMQSGPNDLLTSSLFCSDNTADEKMS